MAITADGRSGSGPDRSLIVTSRIRERRHALGLTQKQVVTRLAALGVMSTNKSLSSLEHGAGIDVGKLPELAAALDCTVTYLLALTDDPTSWQPAGSAPLTAGLSRLHTADPRNPPAAPRSSPTPRSMSDTDTVDRDPPGWILGPFAPMD